MPCHWGNADAPRGVAVLAHRVAVPPGGGVRRGDPVRRRADRSPARPRTATRSPTCRWARGPPAEGEFWESLNTACRLHLPVLFLVADNGYAISVRSEDQATAPISEMVRGFRGLAITKVDGRDYLASRDAGRGPLPACAPVRARASSTPPSPGRTPTPRPTPRRSTGPTPTSRTSATTIRSGCSRSWCVAKGWATARRRRPDPHRGRGRGGRGGQGGARRAPPVARHGARPGAWRSRRSTRPGPARDRRRGGGLRRGDPAHAARGDGRRRAHPRVRRGRRRRPRRADGRGRGQGRGVRHHARAAAHVRHRPVLQHAAGRGEHRRPRGGPGAPRAATRPPRSSSSTTSGPPCSRSRARRRRCAGGRTARSRAPWCCGCRSAATSPAASIWHSQSGESIFAHVPGLIVMFPSRARDAVGHAAGRVPVRGPGALPRAQAPAAPALRPRPVPPAGWVVPVGSGVIDQAGTDLTIVTYGATVEKSRAGRPAPRRRSATRRSRSSTCAASSRGTRTSSPRRSSAPAACSWCTRTSSPAASAPRWRRGSASTASRTSTRPVVAGRRPGLPRRLRADARAGGAPPGGRHRRRRPRAARLLRPGQPP